MKNKLVFSILFLTTCFILNNCENEDTVDYRDKVLGDYYGLLRCQKFLKDTIFPVNGINSYEMSNVVMRISKSKLDSVIDLSFHSIVDTTIYFFQFKFENDSFYSILIHNKPTLKKSNDSIYFYHESGIKYRWLECEAKKNI